MVLDKIEIVLFVGKGCTNGHAFEGAGCWIVWLPVETYSSNRLIDVFVAHEIIHALHYRSSPGYYFDAVAQMRHLGRQLITEGIATYLTRKILHCSLETALWGGYLPERELKTWMADCRARFHEMTAFAARHFHSTRHSEFFQANEPSDILHYRGGYFLGAVVAEAIADKYNLSGREMLGLSRTRLDQQIQLLLAAEARDSGGRRHARLSTGRS